MQAVAARLGVEPVELRFRALARGVTHDTLIVELAGEPAAVLRLAPPRPEILPRHTPAQEGRLLEMLAGSGLPVPEALIIDEDGHLLGRPGLLMSYLHGHNTLTWEQMRERCGSGVDEHALQMMAQMHALKPPDGWPHWPQARAHAERDLAGALRLAEHAGAAAPGELPAALERLAADWPRPSGPPCISHGDYRPANLMAADGQVTAILDWEMATTGDPACDLGVASMREWGQWWPDQELLGRYAQLSGVEVSMRSLLWWRALGYCKVLAFLACRLAEGWEGPGLERWTAGLSRSLKEWGD